MSTRILFLASGGGGNMKFVHRYFQSNSDVEIVAVIADRECGATSYAEAEGISAHIHSFSRTEDEDLKLKRIIDSHSSDIIITNVNKILSPSIVTHGEGKLINLHYSYLPAFSGLTGMAPVDQAIQRNNSFIGTTCHWVTEQVDAGATISQGIFSRLNSSNVYQSVFECGALTLLNGIELLRKPESRQSELAFGSFSISPASELIDYDLTRFIFEGLKS
jgi:phosphoribosylglycinamide formyltransferase-1